MEESLYDEFGNFIGELPPDDDDLNDERAQSEGSDGIPAWLEQEENAAREQSSGRAAAASTAAATDALIARTLAGASAAASSSIVLHEDKKYYPSASEVYGAGVDAVVADEDTQPLSVPIIAPVKAKSFAAVESHIPTTNYAPEFLTTLMSSPAVARHVALAGHLHSGKTTLMDVLISRTHEAAWPLTRQVKYTDARGDEQARGMSIKCTPVSLVLPSSTDKSYLINVVDSPGHVNFSDEVTAAFRVVDGVVIVLDAVEGVMLATERAVRHAVEQGLPILLVVNKMDRLMLELKLPPTDAYFKLMHSIQEVNGIITGAGGKRLVSPVDGSVVFAAALHGWIFTLHSFARMYSAMWHPGGKVPPVDPAALATRLWGDVYFDSTSRRFTRTSTVLGAPRTFVQFILEPLYKIYGQVLGEDVDALGETLAHLHVPFTRTELHMDPQPLLRLIMTRFLGNTSCFVDSLLTHVPSPIDGARAKVEHTYGGSLTSPEAIAMANCDPSGPLMINIVKLYSSPDAATFFAFGRVLSGSLAVGESVRVLGEHYTNEDEEDMAVRVVSGLSIGQARYRIEVSRVVAGNLILIEGVDDVINKTATLTGAAGDSISIATFRPLRFNTLSVMNLSVEPLNPSELPKVLAGLRKIQKSYPLARTRVEESGEHVIIATGEMSMDCIMHDLRTMYAEVEVKVSDPVTSFSETVVDTSSIKCFSTTPNKRNKLTMIAEPLDKGLAADIEAGAISAQWERKRVSDFFTSKYKWDILAARSLWAFGPSERGPNALLDDTLPSEVDKVAVGAARESVVQGFQWACREGPLCDEPIRNTKFKILDASIASEPLHRGGGQIIPTARRVAYSAFLLATPRMMEPVYHVEILAPADAVQAVYAVMARRRGHVTSDGPKPGTPFYVVKGFIPVIDSFGFETDLRVHTQGQAFGLQVFDHWAVVPGDPLDKTIVLRPLEPAPPSHLAREFMVKTRRRKGLSEDVSVTKYFDEEMLLYLAQQEAAATMGSSSAAAAML